MIITKEDIESLTDDEILSLLESVKDRLSFYRSMLTGSKVKLELEITNKHFKPKKAPYHIKILTMRGGRWHWDNGIGDHNWDNFYKRYIQIMRDRKINSIL